MPTDHDLTLAELASLSDVPARTIRYYVAQGILPPPTSAGPASRYPASALARLRLVKQLQRGHLPLAEIRRRLSELTDDEVVDLAATPVLPPPGSALDYVRSVLDHGSSERRPVSAGEGTAPSQRLAAPRPDATPSLTRRMNVEGMPTPAPDVISRVAGMPAPEAGAMASAMMEASPGLPTASNTVARARGVAAPERSQWDRIVIEPDVELHVRRPLSRIANKRVERLLTFARQLLEEDQP